MFHMTRERVTQVTRDGVRQGGQSSHAASRHVTYRGWRIEARNTLRSSPVAVVTVSDSPFQMRVT